MRDINYMSKNDLQTELRNRGLPKSGNKAVLKQRLHDGMTSGLTIEEPQRSTECAELEVFQLEIIGSPEECNSSVSVLTEDFNDFKKYVFDELCTLREQVGVLTDQVAAKDGEIKRLNSLTRQKPKSCDQSTMTLPWPWTSQCSQSTRELPTHRELPPVLPLTNRFEFLRSLPQERESPVIESNTQQPAPTGVRPAGSSLETTSIRNQPRPSTPPVVPGLPTYSDVASDKSTTLIISDSMLNRVRFDDIESNIGANERCVLKKFSGATAKEIGAYAEFNIESHRPTQLIVLARTIIRCKNR